jgi:hypothetical protein
VRHCFSKVILISYHMFSFLEKIHCCFWEKLSLAESMRNYMLFTWNTGTNLTLSFLLMYTFFVTTFQNRKFLVQIILFWRTPFWGNVWLLKIPLVEMFSFFFSCLHPHPSFIVSCKLICKIWLQVPRICEFLSLSIIPHLPWNQ